MRWSRRVGWWTAAAAVVVVGVAGLVWIVRFLVGQTLDDADKWASVLAGLLAFLGLIGATAVFLVRRGAAAVIVTPVEKPLPPAGERLVFGVIPRQARWFQSRPMEQEALEQALAGSRHVGLVALPGARGAGKTACGVVRPQVCGRRVRCGGLDQRSNHPGR